MVARSEAHDSGFCAANASTRTRFSRDLINLTLASPAVNRQQKGARDAAEWLPDQNRCWFAQTSIDVRLAYDLTIDQREADALDRILAGCTSTRISCDLASMREAGWTRGVYRHGGTYQDAWDDAERRTYNLNTERDRDQDGHACE